MAADYPRPVPAHLGGERPGESRPGHPGRSGRPGTADAPPYPHLPVDPGPCRRRGRRGAQGPGRRRRDGRQTTPGRHRDPAGRTRRGLRRLHRADEATGRRRLRGDRVTATLDLDQGQAPKFATIRNPAARSAGRRVSVIAQALGTRLMPWQQLVADVATERNPADPGRYQYPIVVVTVPRQAGKTTLLRAIAVERALSAGQVATFMTAQTGKDAGDRRKDLAGAVERL